MATDLDGDVSPLGVQNVKGVVIDIGHRLLFLDVVIGTDIPHRRLRPPDQDQEQSLRNGGPPEIVLSNLMFTLARCTADNRNVVRLGVATDAPGKAAANRIRCALSSVASDPVNCRHHKRKPPASCPIRKYAFSTMRSTQS